MDKSSCRHGVQCDGAKKPPQPPPSLLEAGRLDWPQPFKGISGQHLHYRSYWLKCELGGIPRRSYRRKFFLAGQTADTAGPATGHSCWEWETGCSADAAQSCRMNVWAAVAKTLRSCDLWGPCGSEPGRGQEDTVPLCALLARLGCPGPSTCLDLALSRARSSCLWRRP